MGASASAAGPGVSFYDDLAELPDAEDQAARLAVRVLLEDAEWVQWSDREIARRCAVGADMVGDLRRELSVGHRQIDPAPRKARRGGTWLLRELRCPRCGHRADD
jgi:hypothetical protein